VRVILTLVQREIGLFFNSLIAYVIVGVFLIGIGLFFWIFPDNVLETGAADLDALFNYGPWFFLFLVPALTMRSFSEEFKSGTLEFLATKPITDWQIVWGKYLAAIVLVLFCLTPTLFYYGTLYWIAEPMGHLDHGSIIGAYLGLFGIGCVFAAIGVFSSSLTDSQIVAFVLGVFACFFLFAAFDFLAELPFVGAFSNIVIQLGINDHYRSISRGVVDSRDVLYYVSVIALFLVYTKSALAAHKR
jgi:ABC-2 type transport system permease protein